MFCPKCGKDLPDNSKFCKYCGSQVKNKGTLRHAPTSTGDNDKAKNIIIVGLVALIVILVLVFAAIGAGMFNGSNDDMSSDASSSSLSDSGAQSLSLSSFPVSEAPGLAQAIKNNGGNFPVNYKSLSLSKSQCLYILTKSVSLIGHGNTEATISVGNPNYAPHPSGRDYPGSIAQANYVDMSDRFSSWIDRNGQVPNYVGIYTGGVPDISPSKMLDIEIAILLTYGSTGNLPPSVSV
ncbi:zinc-ribbon domain-containing protein [uncultured Methanobrevibacter sp.]|uniref:zinc-ribbon domain-containing protein n=1 Tax=uncultured Methanobrevibacter sp. TaxID=253161 RepID=UPI00261635EC|nr:zinc ribbon domain-containing protein [uncultured Methanobrevibacter sp.]